jgi:hypothetical protein
MDHVWLENASHSDELFLLLTFYLIIRGSWNVRLHTPCREMQISVCHPRQRNSAHSFAHHGNSLPSVTLVTPQIL